MVGVDPVIKLTGPIPATRLLLRRSGLGPDDVSLFEVNEAFASVVAAWARELNIPDTKVNVNGGAIALGHPVGATGARLLATLVHELRLARRRARRRHDVLRRGPRHRDDAPRPRRRPPTTTPVTTGDGRP